MIMTVRVRCSGQMPRCVATSPWLNFSFGALCWQSVGQASLFSMSMEIDLESRRPFRLAGQPSNTPLGPPAPEVVATMRAAARRNAEYTAAKPPPPKPQRRLGEPLAEPTAEVRSARDR